MLEAKKDRQKDRNFVIEAVERSLVVFVFAVERPNIGSNEVQVVLFECKYLATS